MRPETPLEHARHVRWWIRIRLTGWLLIGAWQVLSLASEFWPIDLEGRVIRISGKVLGLLGLIFVAYGFERLMLLSDHAVEEGKEGAPAGGTA